MSIRNIIYAASGSATPTTPWISYFYAPQDFASTGVSTLFNASATDANGYTYTSGYDTGLSTNSAYVSKYDTAGNTVWRKRIFGSFTYVTRSIVVDPDGITYACGYNTSSATNEMYLTALNSNGGTQWTKSFRNGSYNTIGYAIAVDKTNNIVYVCGYGINSGTGADGCMGAVYASSGSLRWTSDFTYTNSDYLYAVTTKESQGLAVFAGSSNTGTSTVGIIQRVDSSGADAGSFKFTPSPAHEAQFKGVTQDSANYVIACGDYRQGNVLYTALLVKASANSSSATVSWAVRLNATGETYGAGVCVDANDNIYVVGFTDDQSTGYFSAMIVKYNSSGTVLWQNKLSGPDNVFGYGISYDSANNAVNVVGAYSSATAGSYVSFTAKLPSDGTGHGTYGDLTYGPSYVNSVSTTVSADVYAHYTSGTRSLGSVSTSTMLQRSFYAIS